MDIYVLILGKYLRWRWNTCARFGFVVMVFVLLLAGISEAAVQTDGPLVGGVTDSSAKIFVRTNTSAIVSIEFSTETSLTLSTQTVPVFTSANSDFTAIIELNALLPETTYYYRVLVDGIPQQAVPYPSFATFPHPGSARDFTFAVLSDLASIPKYPDLPARSYARVKNENPAFVLQIGDFDHRDPNSLDEMRRMHREVRGPYRASGSDFSMYIASRFSLFHIWDDHDYGLNNGDKTFPVRADAIQAFQEYYPTPDLPNPAAGIWHKFTYGQVEVFMLDLRSQRDPNTEPDGPDKSMLDGDNIINGQKDWLKYGLLSSTARWKFVVSSVPFNPGSKGKFGDPWNGFENERVELLNFVQQNSIQGVIIISGDLHSGGAIDDGTNSGLPEISVPHTNLERGRSRKLGTWSEGVISGADSTSAGYGIITVMTNPDKVILETKGADGVRRIGLVISAP